MREAESKGMPPGGEFTMNNGEARKTSFERYQTIMKSPHDEKTRLRLQTPPASMMDEVREEQKVRVIAEGIRSQVGKSRKAFGVRQTLVNWIMLSQKHAVMAWKDRMKTSANREKVLMRSLRRCGRVPLLRRVLDWWFLYLIKVRP